MCGQILAVFVFLYEANIVHLIFQKRKHSCIFMQHGFKWRGQRKGEEMNKGQMVSSAGLCFTLQSKIPAEFEEHNYDCKSKLSEFSTLTTIFTSLGRSRCVAS